MYLYNANRRKINLRKGGKTIIRKTIKQYERGYRFRRRTLLGTNGNFLQALTMEISILEKKTSGNEKIKHNLVLGLTGRRSFPIKV